MGFFVRVSTFFFFLLDNYLLRWFNGHVHFWINHFIFFSLEKVMQYFCRIKNVRDLSLLVQENLVDLSATQMTTLLLNIIMLTPYFIILPPCSLFFQHYHHINFRSFKLLLFSLFLLVKMLHCTTTNRSLCLDPKLSARN